MLTDVKAPGFPESVTDGTIVAWRKKPGDAVRRDETLVDIETDKVVFEVPSPDDGMLAEVLSEEGAKVASGQVLGRIDAVAVTGAQAGNGADQAAVDMPVNMPDSDTAVSPAARRLIAEHGLKAGQVEGSGRDGRVLKEDVLRVVEQGAQPAHEPMEKAVATPVVLDFPAGDRPQKRVPMTRLRARIAERLVEAQHAAAILSTFNEVNMAPVMDLRQRYRERFEQEYGVKLGFMSFFIRASIEALKRFPVVNASIEDSDIVYHGFYDVGVAVSSPRGLVVPIVRDADRLGIAALERNVAALAEKAREGTLSIDEITGGTFTITNGGVFGSLLSTPILNPPQSAILGMHKIQERPVVENGAIVARPMMYLALSYDHRLIDGRDAVQFLVTIKDMLEDPSRLLLEI
jgi:2-oxoglutarate dehydrogenase E2 component (dihydrolipoamide succinyltransferase)